MSDTEEEVKISDPPPFNTASMVYLEKHAILLGNFIIPQKKKKKKKHVKSMAISLNLFSNY